MVDALKCENLRATSKNKEFVMQSKILKPATSEQLNVF